MTNLMKHIDQSKLLETIRHILDHEGQPAFPPPMVPLKNISEGTATHIVAAFDPSIKSQGGSYLTDCKITNDIAKPYALDNEAAKKLWALSEQMVNYKVTDY